MARIVGLDIVSDQRRIRPVDVLAPEQLDEVISSHLLAGSFDLALNDAGELDLEQPREHEIVLGAHHVPDAALARL